MKQWWDWNLKPGSLALLCSPWPAGVSDSRLRTGWITEAKNELDLGRNWISLLRTFLRCWVLTIIIMVSL